MNDHLLCLIVDDEPLAQQIVENYIARLGSLKLVAKCETVQEAYQVLNSQHVDVIFLDLQLEETWGTQLISKITRDESLKYYVVITSATRPETVDIQSIFKSQHLIFVDYLTKPFSFDRFHHVVKKILNDKTPGK